MFRVFFFVKLFCSLVVTCWEKADLLALLYAMLSCVFVTFPYSVPGQVWYLIVPIPDLCLLSYFDIINIIIGIAHLHMNLLKSFIEPDL